MHRKTMPRRNFWTKSCIECFQIGMEMKKIVGIVGATMRRKIQRIGIQMLNVSRQMNIPVTEATETKKIIVKR